ncbi:MAG: hypothetical protein ACFFB0_02330 [Promethearchaeota archaeon]
MKNFKKLSDLELNMVDATLIVNEQKIPLKDFMQEMLANIILGYLNSTKKVPENIKTIKIEINL